MGQITLCLEVLAKSKFSVIAITFGESGIPARKVRLSIYHRCM